MKPEGCKGCPYENRPGPVWSDGDPLTAEIALVAEAPGKDEIAGKKGLIGAAGHEFWKLAAVVGIKRDRCFVANVVKCLPPGADKGDYSLDARAIAQCSRQFLNKEIDSCRTDVVIVMGRTALQWATGETNIMRWRGTTLSR